VLLAQFTMDLCLGGLVSTREVVSIEEPAEGVANIVEVVEEVAGIKVAAKDFELAEHTGEAQVLFTEDLATH